MSRFTVFKQKYSVPTKFSDDVFGQ